MPDSNDDSKSKPQSSNASARLTQVSNHLSRSRKSRRSQDGPPADWSDIWSQIQQMREIASTPPTSNRGYIKQKQAGKLWVRERIELLVDPGSFKEVGSVSGTVDWKPSSTKDSTSAGNKEQVAGFVPSNNVQGFAKVNGRKVLLTADDFSIRAGHADGANGLKTVYIEKLALELRLPIIKLVDGSSGGGSVTTIRTDGYSYVPPTPMFHSIVKQLDMGIPNLGAILGPAIGLGAARVTSCHFSTMATDVGALFNAGPAVVAKATFEEGLSASELGGPSIHCTNGTIDNPCDDEKGCIEALKRFLSYMPSCGQIELPPRMQSEDSLGRDISSLRTLIPRRKQRAYNIKRAIEEIVDLNSFFEIGPAWGLTAFVGLARIDGRPVGIIASNPEVGSGAIDAYGAQKMVRHLKLCDVFNLPVVQLVDCPGYAIGTVAEKAATMKWGVELAKAYYGSTLPLLSIIVRKCYGVAGAVMVDSRDPHQRVAWPSGEWGSLPLEGGIEASHAHELRAAGEKAKERYAELLEDYTRLQSPVRTANAFGIEEIIDPADSRRFVASWTQHMYEVKLPERLVERQNGRLHVQFR